MTADHPTPGAPPSPAALPRLRRRPVVVALVIAVVLLLIGGGGVLVWPALFTTTAAATGGEVFLEPATTPGQDPFTDDVVVGNPPGTKSQSPVGGGGGGVPSITGDTPALYGGSRDDHLCDKGKLITFLEQNPAKAAAWSGVLGVQPSQIADYVVSLTPVQLRADTRVTNHGYVNGHATTLQSVLQAGTAVLVDATGRPRVKCGCGNPLGDPVALSDVRTYSGTAWPGFDRRGLAVIAPGAHPIDRFLVIDLRTGERFYRPVGSGGDKDVPVDPAPITTVPVPVPVPDPVPPPNAGPPPPTPCPAGAQRRGATCVVVAPVVPTPGCPAGQEPGGGACRPIACPSGQQLSGGVCKPITCARGQALSGGTCKPITCPEGETLSGGVCTPPPTCPEGETLIDGACSPPPTVCPGGGTASGGTCAPLPTGNGCPPGMVPVSGGDCSTPPCPAGTVRDSQGECVTSEGRRRRARSATRGRRTRKVEPDPDSTGP